MRGGSGEAGAWLAVGGSKKLQFGLGIRAVAASQSMSSASGQRVWPKAGPGPIPWPSAPGRAPRGPVSFLEL